MIEARVALAGPARLGRVDPVEVVDDRLHRRAEAVEVEPVEAGLGRRVRLGSRCGPAATRRTPATSRLRHIHAGKRRKSDERGVGVGVVRQAHDVAVDAVGVGPVGLDRDGGEAALVDQAPGDAGSLPVELVGAVRGLADQHEPPVAHEVEQAVVVPGLVGDGPTVVREGGESRRHRHRSSVSGPAGRHPGTMVPTAYRWRIGCRGGRLGVIRPWQRDRRPITISLVDSTTTAPPVVLTPEQVAVLPLVPLGTNAGVTHRVLWSSGTSMAGVMRVEEGHRLGVHTHRANHHHMWILDGRATILGSELDPGSYVHIPSGVEHDIDASATDGCTLLYLYLSPPD